MTTIYLSTEDSEEANSDKGSLIIGTSYKSEEAS